jgi:uncharacterized membrane protein
MSDQIVPHTQSEQERTLPVIIYVLYLLGFCTAGATALVGFIMALFLSGSGTPLQQSHYTFQLRTVFLSLIWIVLSSAVFVVGLILTMALIGFSIIHLSGFMFGVTGLWFAARCILGVAKAWENQPYPRPQSYLV